MNLHKPFVLLFIFLITCLINQKVYSQSEEPLVNVVDDIQFDLKSVTASGDTLIIDLFAISYDKNPREFRLNVFASSLLDQNQESHLFHSIQMDRVIVKLEDRENYLNYLLHQDAPVAIRLKITPMSDEIIHAQKVKLVFSSLEEEGRFLDAWIDLSEPEDAN